MSSVELEKKFKSVEWSKNGRKKGVKGKGAKSN